MVTERLKFIYAAESLCLIVLSLILLFPLEIHPYIGRLIPVIIVDSNIIGQRLIVCSELVRCCGKGKVVVYTRYSYSLTNAVYRSYHYIMPGAQ